MTKYSETNRLSNITLKEWDYSFLRLKPNLIVSTRKTVSVIFVGWSPVKAVIRKKQPLSIFFLRIKVHRVLAKLRQVFSLGSRSLGGLKGGREGRRGAAQGDRKKKCIVQIISPVSSLVFPRCFSVWLRQKHTSLPVSANPPPRTRARARCLPPVAERTQALTPSPKLTPRLPAPRMRTAPPCSAWLSLPFATLRPRPKPTHCSHKYKTWRHLGVRNAYYWADINILRYHMFNILSLQDLSNPFTRLHLFIWLEHPGS